MDKARLLRIMRTIGIFPIIALIAGCNLWGVDDLKVTITSPSGDTTISAGQSVNFQSEASFGTGPYTYQWDFGGGATDSTVQNPGSTIFSTAGTFTVNVTVTDSKGDTAQDSVIVTVSTSTSTAFTVSITPPSIITVAQAASFQSTVSNGTGPFTYLWNFSGATPGTSTVPNPSLIIFDTTGPHTVTLTVTDTSNGATAQASVSVTVSS